MKKLIIVIGALALTGCVSHNFREGARETWRCAAHREFSLRHVGDAVELYAAGVTHRLAPTGEGQYSGGDVTLSVSHGRATLTGVYNGPFENCRRRGWF